MGDASLSSMECMRKVFRMNNGVRISAATRRSQTAAATGSPHAMRGVRFHQVGRSTARQSDGSRSAGLFSIPSSESDWFTVSETILLEPVKELEGADASRPASRECVYGWPARQRRSWTEPVRLTFPNSALMA